MNIKVKRGLSFSLALLLVLTGSFGLSFFIRADSEIAYIDQFGSLMYKGSDEVTVLTGNIRAEILTDTDPETNGWYLWSGGTFSNGGRLQIDGNVHLILEDGLNVSISGGIEVSAGNSLTIYAQSTGDSTMGRLTTNLPGSELTGFAGIGGNDEEDGGKITINGGIIMAGGGLFAAGIGGGRGADNGEVIINGGIVTARGSSTAAGIGGSSAVLKQPTSDPDDDYFAGGGGGTVFINGGVVTAISGNSTARAIGTGKDGTNAIVSVSGRYHYWVNTSAADNSNSTDFTTGNFSNNTNVFRIDEGYSFIKLVSLPAYVDMTVRAPGDVVYGTMPGNPVASLSGTTAIGTYSFTYSYSGVLSDGKHTTYGPDAAKPTEPGEYTVTATLVHDTYSGSAVSQPFTIAVRSLTWTTGRVNDKPYDGTTDAVISTQPALTGIIQNDNVSVSEGTAVFNSVGPSSNISVLARNYSISGSDMWKYDVPVAQPPFANAAISPAPSPSPSPDTSPSPSPDASPSPSPDTSPSPAPSPSPSPSPSPGPGDPGYPSPAPMPTVPPDTTPAPTPVPRPTPDVVSTPRPAPVPPEDDTDHYEPPAPPEDWPVLYPDGEFDYDVEFISVNDWFEYEYDKIEQQEYKPLQKYLWIFLTAAAVLTFSIFLVIAAKRKKE